MAGHNLLHFPEPTDPDDTWGADEEQPVDWLSRSTLPRARSIRDALNENLSHFEPKHAASLAKKLRSDWKSFYFELLVGRWLQELGGEVEHEPLGSNGRRIDYRASWVDGRACVEAYSKRMNLHARQGVAYIDNSEQRIRLAYTDWRKRKQAEGASDPAMLAIDGGIFGAHDYDFDNALLGPDVQHMGLDREVAGLSHRAYNGEMLRDTAGTWAAVLAFLEAGVFRAREPILYVSPHFEGHLPLAFLGVERRMLAPKTFERVEDEPMQRIRFGVPLPSQPDEGGAHTD
jgi:hypothetical protein